MMHCGNKCLITRTKLQSTISANFTGKVYGSDIDSRVINTAKQNARKAGISDLIEFSCKDAGKINNVFSKPGVMLFNPPYGERIGELPELVELFGEFGGKLKQQYTNWRVCYFNGKH